MARKEIPARIEITCDVCGVVCTSDFGKGQRQKEGKLIIQQPRFVIQRDTDENYSRAWDLCDDCLTRIAVALDDMADQIRRDSKEE